LRKSGITVYAPVIFFRESKREIKKRTALIEVKEAFEILRESGVQENWENK
jgi:hypothetical protein